MFQNFSANWMPTENVPFTQFSTVMISSVNPFLGAVIMVRVMERSSQGFHVLNGVMLFGALALLAFQTLRVYAVYKKLAPRVLSPTCDPALRETFRMMLKTLMVANALVFLVEIVILFRQ